MRLQGNNTTQTKNDIIVSDVSKSFKLGRNRVPAVSHVSLYIKNGELLALVGPSGSGKTTLTHIIGGLTRPDQGSVQIGGRKLPFGSDGKLSDYRNRYAGFIFQTFGLIPHYTALENVCIPLVISGMSPRTRTKLAQKCLETVGMAAYASQRISTLSGGQRQRVSIARALVANPPIIIADEPTGSLDSKNGQVIMDILKHLSHEQAKTVLFVTHDQSLAAQADRIISLKDGQIAKDAT